MIPGSLITLGQYDIGSIHLVNQSAVDSLPLVRDRIFRVDPNTILTVLSTQRQNGYILVFHPRLGTGYVFSGDYREIIRYNS